MKQKICIISIATLIQTEITNVNVNAPPPSRDTFSDSELLGILVRPLHTFLSFFDSGRWSVDSLLLGTATIL